MQWLTGWRAWAGLKKSAPKYWAKGGMVVVMGIMAWVFWSQLFPSRQRRSDLQAQPPLQHVIQPLTTSHDVTVSETLETQKRNARLENQHREDVVNTREIKQELAKLREENKQAITTMQRQHDDTVKRLQAAHTQAKQTPRVPPRQGTDPEVARLRADLSKLRAEKDQGPSAMPAGSYDPKTFNKFEILHTKDPMSYPMPPSPYRDDTVYLGAGCFAPIEVVTGVPATARTDRARQIMVDIRHGFKCAYQQRGPHLEPLETEIPVQGAFAFAAVQADMSAQRVMGEVQLLTMVMPNKAFFERPIKGYLVGEDGVLGLPGELESHEGRKIAMASVYGAAKEAASLIGLAKSQFTAVYSGGPPPGSGMQSVLDDIGRFYLDQARALQHTLLVPPGKRGYLVITEGFPLDGYPTQTVFTSGGGR